MRLLREILRSLTKALPFGLIGVVLTLAVWPFVLRGWHEVTPTSWYFNYEDITPHTALVGEQLEFTSIVEVNSQGHFVYIDTLKCHNGKTVYKTFKSDSPATLGRAEATWPFPFTPDSPADCRLVSLITLELSDGTHKQQTVYTQVKITE